jgi:hypothetical protein
MQKIVSQYFRPMFITRFVCLAAALVLSSCSKKPQQAILGKWNAEESKSLVEFRPDGTVTTLENGTTSTAKYKFLSETNFEMEVTAMINTNKITIQMMCGVAIHGDTAELTLNIPGQAGRPAQSHLMHLNRIK